MTSFRAAVAFAALLIASVPAVGLRIAEWSIDPRAELDEGRLVERLQEVLSSEEIGIPPIFRLASGSRSASTTVPEGWT